MPKGYFTPSGYMGYINYDWMLFASESDYLEYLKENEQNDNEHQKIRKGDLYNE